MQGPWHELPARVQALGPSVALPAHTEGAGQGKGAPRRKTLNLVVPDQGEGSLQDAQDKRPWLPGTCEPKVCNLQGFSPRLQASDTPELGFIWH